MGWNEWTVLRVLLKKPKSGLKHKQEEKEAATAVGGFETDSERQVLYKHIFSAQPDPSRIPEAVGRVPPHISSAASRTCQVGAFKHAGP